MQSSETQVNQSAVEVNSTGYKKSQEDRDRQAAYMRAYRKRRKLASGAKVAIEAENGAGVGQGIPEAQSSLESSQAIVE